MHIVHRLIAAAALAFALAAPASAQFFARYDITFDSPPSCDGGGMGGLVTGTFTANYPPGANNSYTSYSINGGAPAVERFSNPSGPVAVPLSSSPFVVLLPVPATPPYTLTALAFTAINGLPTGLGVQLNGVCNADGTATITLVNDIPAPSLAVPTLQAPVLAALAALLALLAFTGLRRSRR